jgi:hypothetical protein
MTLPKTIIITEQEPPASEQAAWLRAVLDGPIQSKPPRSEPIPIQAWIIMRQTKAVFFARLEWQKEIQLFDADGYVVLDDTRRAKITLYGSYVYRAVKVQIISKTHGEIDQKVFYFRDYLDFSRKISINPNYEGQFEARYYEPNGFDWYMHKPETTRPLCAAIEAWIDLYK